MHETRKLTRLLCPDMPFERSSGQTDRRRQKSSALTCDVVLSEIVRKGKGDGSRNAGAIFKTGGRNFRVLEHQLRGPRRQTRRRTLRSSFAHIGTVARERIFHASAFSSSRASTHSATYLFVGRILLIRNMLAQPAFSFFVSARGCTRITLNVTRLSGAHAASKLSPVYNCAACARMHFVFLSEWRSEINVVQRGVIRLAGVSAKLCFIYIAAAWCSLPRSVNRNTNKYLSGVYQNDDQTTRLVLNKKTTGKRRNRKKKQPRSEIETPESRDPESNKI